MPTLDLIVFDIAGTTVNDRTPDGDAVNRCLQQAVSAAGVAVSADDVNRVMGIFKPDAIRMLFEAKGRLDLLPKVDATHDDFVERMKRFYRSDPSVRPVDGAADVFRTLREQGIKVALDTGFGREITAIVLDRLGWKEGPLADGGTIDASVTSDEVPRGRPHPDMILSIMRRLGVGDVQCVAKVGDTPADLYEGTNTGCKLVIGVTGGTHTRAQLEPHPHTHLIHTVAELPELLKSVS